MTFPRRGALRDKANSRRAGSTRSSLRNSWRSINDVGATWAAAVTAAKSYVHGSGSVAVLDADRPAFNRVPSSRQSNHTGSIIELSRAASISDRITIHRASGTALTSNFARKGHLRESASRITYNWSRFTPSLKRFNKLRRSAREKSLTSCRRMQMTLSLIMNGVYRLEAIRGTLNDGRKNRISAIEQSTRSVEQNPPHAFVIT